MEFTFGQNIAKQKGQRPALRWADWLGLMVGLTFVTPKAPPGFAVQPFSITLIFAGQAFNLTFTWYQPATDSSITRGKAGAITRLNARLRFKTFDLPSGTAGPDWNGIVSPARRTDPAGRDPTIHKSPIAAFANPFTWVLFVLPAVSFFTDVVMAPCGQKQIPIAANGLVATWPPVDRKTTSAEAWRLAYVSGQRHARQLVPEAGTEHISFM